jgi:hypothetical protein
MNINKFLFLFVYIHDYDASDEETRKGTRRREKVEKEGEDARQGAGPVFSEAVGLKSS